MFSTLTDACGTAAPPGSSTVPPKLAVVYCALTVNAQNKRQVETTNQRDRITYVQEGIQLAVNQAATQTIVLAIGGVSEKITVSADAELVATRNATSGQLIDQRKITDLPLNGRQAQALIYLAPGTSTPPAATAAELFRRCISG